MRKAEDDEEQIAQALIDYGRTGEIHDILLTMHNQAGKWVLDTRGDKQNPRLLKKLFNEKISKEIMIRTNEFGEKTFFGSMTGKFGNVIKFHHVRGDIDTTNIKFLNAPNLKTIGGGFYAFETLKLSIPKLETVRDIITDGVLVFHAPVLKRVSTIACLVLESFDAPQLLEITNLIILTPITVNVPSLESVTGVFIASSAETLNAPNLKFVEGELDTQAAADFHPVNLKVIGDWKMHPVAKELWSRKKTKALLKNQREIEI